MTDDDSKIDAGNVRETTRCKGMESCTEQGSNSMQTGHGKGKEWPLTLFIYKWLKPLKPSSKAIDGKSCLASMQDPRIIQRLSRTIHASARMV